MSSPTNFNYHSDRMLIGAVLIGDIIIAILTFLLFCRHMSGICHDDAIRQTITVSIMLYFACTYRNGVVLHRRRASTHLIVMRVMSNMFKFTILSVLLFTIGDFWHMEPSRYALCMLTMTVLISIYRVLVRRIVVAWRRKPNHVHNVVIVGSSENAAELYKEVMETVTLGYNVNGYFDDERDPLFPEKATYLGKPEDVLEYLKKHPEVHEVYCCLPSKRSAEIVPIIHYCMQNFLHFFSMPNVRNYVHHRMHFTMFGNVACMSLYNEPLSRVENRFIKRAFDIIVSLIFLCTLFPFILLLVGIVTKITMPGPIFFRQKRTGLDGKDFYCLKFRSMKVNNDADTVQATLNDPRKTKWGNIMRKTNLDEMPQFINVLLGQMSIVGPRPHMVKQTNDYSKIIDYYMVRHLIKPGITGWSQVTGFRGETKEIYQMEGRVRGDIWYMEHWTIWLDIYIMYKTVANVVQGDKNAY